MNIFKQITGYKGLYSACSNGDIISLPKKTRKGTRILKPIKVTFGYYAVDLVKDKKVKRFLVHRLIANTFIDNKSSKPQVNHINGLKSDNRLENLEWNTQSENQKHAIKIGLRSAKGEKNSQSKLTNNKVLEIFKDNSKYSIIAKKYNISIPTISDIKRGYSWCSVTGMESKKI
jgi:hypothetical protein